MFEMTGAGLVEVPNPCALFLDERPEGVSGSAVIPSMEGTRPLLVEVQALSDGEPFGFAATHGDGGESKPGVADTGGAGKTGRTGILRNGCLCECGGGL